MIHPRISIPIPILGLALLSGTLLPAQQAPLGKTNPVSPAPATNAPPAAPSPSTSPLSKAQTLEEDAMHLSTGNSYPNVTWLSPTETKVRLKDGPVVMRKLAMQCEQTAWSKPTEPNKAPPWPVTKFILTLQVRERPEQIHLLGQGKEPVTTRFSTSAAGWVRFAQLEEARGRRTITFLRPKLSLGPNGERVYAGTIPGGGEPVEYKLEGDKLTIKSTAEDMTRFFDVAAFPDLGAEVEFTFKKQRIDMGW